MSRLSAIDWSGWRSRPPQDWSWQLHLLSCLLAAVLTAGAGWLLLLQPLEQQRQVAMAEQLSLQQQRESLQRQLQRQPEVVRIRQQLTGLQEQLQRELPQDWQESVWQARLQFAVPGLQLRRFKPMKPKRLEGDQAFSTCQYSSSTGASRPKMLTETRSLPRSGSISSTMPV